MCLLYNILKLKMPIVEALQHPTTATKAKDLIRSHQSRKCEICRDCLLLGGIAISKEEISNCMFTDEKQALIFFSSFLDCAQLEFVFSGQCVEICGGTSGFLD
jgi:hypothetical protein